ncbi:MAG: hypothetical protein JWQ34_1535 [Mucilaginibacter sp.]|nr:hypothetical protein [Mucilaginibacter sp.]
MLMGLLTVLFNSYLSAYIPAKGLYKRVLIYAL